MNSRVSIPQSRVQRKLIHLNFNLCALKGIVTIIRFIRAELVTERLNGAGGNTHEWPQIWMGEDVAVVGDCKGVAVNAQLG